MTALFFTLTVIAVGVFVTNFKPYPNDKPREPRLFAGDWLAGIAIVGYIAYVSM